MSREYIHTPATLGERLADGAAGLIGSWRFLIVQAALLALWVFVNALRITGFDPPPFILLNLMLSFQAAFTGPVLLIAANRAAQRDHARDDLEAQEVAELFNINKQQLVILDQQTEILELLNGQQQPATMQVLAYPKVRSG